jgi:hypothetical protein
MSFNSANCRGQRLLQTDLDTTNRTDVFNMPSWDIALCQLVNVELLTTPIWLNGPLSSCISVTNLGTSPTCTLFSIWQDACYCHSSRVDNSCTGNRTLLTCITGVSCSLVSLLDASYISVPGKGRYRHFAPSLSATPFGNSPAPWVLNSPFFRSSQHFSSS